MDISKTFKSFGFLMKKHSPEILTGVGIAGMISTTVIAVRATPKAWILIEEERERAPKSLIFLKQLRQFGNVIFRQW